MNLKFKATDKQQIFIQSALSGKYDFILFGGAIRGGKTFALLGFFLMCSFLFPGSKYVVIRETIEVIKSTVIPTFYKLMPRFFTLKLPSASNGWEWVARNGSIIKFFGVDIGKDPNLDRLRGLEFDSCGLEEMDVQKAVFEKAMERVGTWRMDERMRDKANGKQIPPALTLGTCNPRKDWVKKEIYDKYRIGALNPKWHYIQSRVYDNNHIDQSWIESKRLNMTPKMFMMFIDGDWDVDLNDDPFFTFYRDHIHFTNQEFEFDPYFQTMLAFDFNYDPTTVSIYQDLGYGIAGMRCYEAKGGTKLLCELLSEQDDLMSVPRDMWVITGDSSGMSKSSTAGDRTDYTIIMEHFDLHKDQLKGVHKRNAAHVYSRKLCDYFFQNVPFRMDMRMKFLRDDIIKAKPNSQGALFKDRSKGFPMDHLDNFRYFVNMYFPGGIQDINDYVNNCKMVG